MCKAYFSSMVDNISCRDYLKQEVQNKTSLSIYDKTDDGSRTFVDDVPLIQFTI